MVAASTNEDKTLLKVLVHKEKNKVIYAEADGKFVNTLFSIMTLPIGTIVRILERCSDKRLNPLESLQNLYRSLVELPADYFSYSAEERKFLMLNPRTSLYDICRMLKINIDDTEPTKYFVCQNEGCYQASGSYFSTCSVARCDFCEKVMSREIKYNKGYDHIAICCEDSNVFVSNSTTFIVTDDLRVMPSTLDLSLGLLSDLGFTDTSHVEERTIDIGCEQMLILVKAALILKYPLTYLVFHSIHPITSGGLVNPKLGTSVQHLTSNGNDRNSKTMKLRVTLQKSTSKFLFAEAEEDFVEFLFGFLEIPLGTLIGKLMNGKSSLECLENVYGSICNMNLGGIQDRWRLLMKPELAWKHVSKNQIFPLDVSSDSKDIFQCSFLDGTLMRYTCGLGDSRCIMRLKDPMWSMEIIDQMVAGRFMLTDDLIVTPFSSVSAIAIMNKLKVPLKDVEQHEVSIGIEKGLQLLYASLKSNSTLTDVLLEEIIKKKKGLQPFMLPQPRDLVGFHSSTVYHSAVGHRSTAQSPPQSAISHRPILSSTRLGVKKAAPKGKAAKDRNKHQRPVSAFFVFMEDFRKQENNGNKSIAAVGKAGGAKWKSMSDAEKAPFIVDAEKRKKEYEKTLASNNKKLVDDDDSDDEYDDDFDDEGRCLLHLNGRFDGCDELE